VSAGLGVRLEDVDHVDALVVSEVGVDRDQDQAAEAGAVDAFSQVENDGSPARPQVVLHDAACLLAHQ
jgi:hypothetical protein